MRPSLAELIEEDEFVRRHIGPEADDQQRMLDELGVDSLDALLDATVPPAIRMALSLIHI